MKARASTTQMYAKQAGAAKKSFDLCIPPNCKNDRRWCHRMRRADGSHTGYRGGCNGRLRWDCKKTCFCHKTDAAKQCERGRGDWENRKQISTKWPSEPDHVDWLA